jgi:hypothetical protein
MHKNTWLNSKFGRGEVCIGAYRVQFKFWEWRVYFLVNYQLYFYSLLWKHIFKWVTENGHSVTRHGNCPPPLESRGAFSCRETETKKVKTRTKATWTYFQEMQTRGAGQAIDFEKTEFGLGGQFVL